MKITSSKSHQRSYTNSSPASCAYNVTPEVNETSLVPGWYSVVVPHICVEMRSPTMSLNFPPMSQNIPLISHNFPAMSHTSHPWTVSHNLPLTSPSSHQWATTSHPWVTTSHLWATNPHPWDTTSHPWATIPTREPKHTTHEVQLPTPLSPVSVNN